MKKDLEQKKGGIEKIENIHRDRESVLERPEREEARGGKDVLETNRTKRRVERGETGKKTCTFGNRGG